jgi:chromosome segregation ATPase
LEKSLKIAEEKEFLSSNQLKEYSQQLSQLQNEKTKLQLDYAELQHKLQQAEERSEQCTVIKITLKSELADLNQQLFNEKKQLVDVLNQSKQLHLELEQLKQQLSDEQFVREELQLKLNKTNFELREIKAKQESEVLVTAEKVDDAKKKFSLKLNEADERFDQILAKCSSLEATKLRLQHEVDDLVTDIQETTNNAIRMEKKQSQFEKLVEEWKLKCQQLAIELQNAKKSSGNSECELGKLRAQYDESNEQINCLRKENTSMAEVCKELMLQVTERETKSHEINKALKKLELENEQLRSGLKDAYGSLDYEEKKVLNGQNELAQLRNKVDRILLDKEEEFEIIK